jgi:hypothetical protein
MATATRQLTTQAIIVELQVCTKIEIIYNSNLLSIMEFPLNRIVENDSISKENYGYK